MSFLLQFKQWLTSPVVQDAGIDRPFRLRRLSLWLMIAGWVTFFASCLVGLWLVRHGFVIAGYHELAGIDAGSKIDIDGRLGNLVLQNILKITELAGATLFIGGMISVSLFDKVDRVAIWRAE